MNDPEVPISKPPEAKAIQKYEKVLGDIRLYHGASQSFSLDKQFDYHSNEGKSLDGGGTAGAGLYLTSIKAAAEHYSKARQKSPEATPVVHEYSAAGSRMIDLTDPQDPSINRLLPREFAQEWFDSLEPQYGSVTNDQLNQMIGTPEGANLRSEYFYFKYLKDLLRQKTRSDLDLREILQTNKGGFGGPMAARFGDFVKSQSFDGLIYNEGGERIDRGSQGGAGPSYVFFDITKVEQLT